MFEPKLINDADYVNHEMKTSTDKKKTLNSGSRLPLVEMPYDVNIHSFHSKLCHEITFAFDHALEQRLLYSLT